MESSATNVVIAGLEGQGVVKACEILVRAAGLAGFDVKKSELHGESQRGGSVACGVRFGRQVPGPVIPRGQADFLVVLFPGALENYVSLLRQEGEVLRADEALAAMLAEKSAMNLAMLGRLSNRLSIGEDCWVEAIAGEFEENRREASVKAFFRGRKGAR